jgi:hypothetical protein
VTLPPISAARARSFGTTIFALGDARGDGDAFARVGRVALESPESSSCVNSDRSDDAESCRARSDVHVRRCALAIAILASNPLNGRRASILNATVLRYSVSPRTASLQRRHTPEIATAVDARLGSAARICARISGGSAFAGSHRAPSSPSSSSSRSSSPRVRVVALDALGAPLEVDDAGTTTETTTDDGAFGALDEATESLACVVDGAFVATVVGLAGAAGLVRGDGDDVATGGGGGGGGGGGDGRATTPTVTVATCESSPIARGATADGAAAKTVAASRPSRAHELLTTRAREVFAAAMATGATGDEGASASGGGGEERRTLLAAIEALALWLDDHHDVFTAGDPANDGKVLAPDLDRGGVLVPSRLLR